MEVSFKQIISDFEDFADSHNQINDFDWGSLADLNSKEKSFPILFIQPVTSSHAGVQLDLNFECYILDLSKEDDKNLEKDLLSNTLEIGNDFIAEFYNGDYDYIFDEDVNIEPIRGDFDDLLSGWRFDVISEVVNKPCRTNTPKNL